MSVLHPILLGLVGLAVGIPIVLHLLMRRRPKHRVFPAFLFLQKRRVTNERKLQLRHWLLLLMRCCAIAALGFALTGLTVASAAGGHWLLVLVSTILLAVTAGIALICWRHRRGPAIVAGMATVSCVMAVLTMWLFVRALGGPQGSMIGTQQAPVAAVMVFDNSVRMLYRESNQRRIEVAKEIAEDLMADLPRESELAILSSSHSEGNFAVSIATARNEIRAISTSFESRSIMDAIRSALDLLAISEKASRELYIFSDLTNASWRVNSTVDDRFDGHVERPAIYVIDVGSEAASNDRLQPPKLAADTVTGGNAVHLTTAVTSTGAMGSRTVELLVERPDPRLPMIVDGVPKLPDLVLRDQQTVSAGMNETVSVEFDVRGMPVGTHHGQIRLTGSDGLELDDITYFTVQVSPTWPVLIAASPEAGVQWMTSALSAAEQDGARFDCENVSLDRIGEIDLDRFRCVCLLDPGPLATSSWRKLTQYVHQGGGLAVFLGPHADPVTTFNQPEAQSLLPGRLLRHWRSGSEPLFLTSSSLAHPILDVFHELETTIPWGQFPVNTHWALGDLNADCQTLFRFSNNHPALVARRVGRGHAITMTTSSSASSVSSSRRWNELTTALNPWPMFVLVEQTFEFLAQWGDGKLNYEVGQSVVLPDPSTEPRRYQLFTPDSAWQDVAAEKGEVRIPLATTPGTYRLKATPGQATIQGFSINLQPNMTDLTRVTPPRLDELLGEGQYRLARGREKIERQIGQVRTGMKLYPWLMALLAFVLAMEQFLANRFYQTNRFGLASPATRDGIGRSWGWPSGSAKAPDTRSTA